MKIKEICEKTGLTDRTVRFYIEEQLISPFYTENYLGRRSFDFSEQDLEQLKNIATLRAFGFSIEELKALSCENADHSQIVEAVRDRAEESLDESKRRLGRLSGLDPSEETSISSLAQKLSASDIGIQNESSIPRKKRSFASFLYSLAIFLSVWLPIILPITVLVLKIATVQLPIVRPIFLVCILLCFLPSMVTVIIPKKKNGAKGNLRTAFILLCVLCIPVGIFLSSKCVTSCGHSYETYRVILDATCQQEGEMIVKCDECGGFGSKKVEKLPHSGIIVSGVAPTCATGGISDGYNCQLCNDILIEQKRLPPTDMHVSVTDAAIEPTCTKTGLSEGSHCSVCDKVLEAQAVVAMIDHSPVAIEAVSPTCKDTGLSAGSFCSVCNTVLIKQEIIPVTEDHVAVIDAAVLATCKDTGLTEGSHCSVCDKVLIKQKIIPVTEDHVAVIDAAITAGCEKAGKSEGSHCSVCGEILSAQEPVPAKGHSYTSRTVAPTCGSVGYTLHECICGKSYRSDTVRQTNEHDFKPSDVGYTCRVCRFEAITQGDAGEGSTVKYYVYRSDSLQNCVALVICGYGDMPDYTPEAPPPWEAYAKRINIIIIESNVTSVGEYAFYDQSYEVNAREMIIRSKHVLYDKDHSGFMGIDPIMCEIILDY